MIINDAAAETTCVHIRLAFQIIIFMHACCVAASCLPQYVGVQIGKDTLGYMR